MSASAGLRPVRSLHTSTAGHLPVPWGVNSRASVVPAGVVTVTAACTTAGAGAAASIGAVAHEPRPSASTARPAAASGINVGRIIAACPSIDREDAALDMPLAAVDLHRVVLAVEVVDHADLAVVGHPGVGIAEVPAAAV